MMLTKQQVKALRAVIRRLVNAEREDQWKGGGHPEDIPVIERELALARQNLNKTLHKLSS